jgi:DNA replication protein DnaC
MTVVDAALHASLRTLKLSGMLETLPARLTQAQAGELGHLDFLQVLCQDEIARRESMAIYRRLRRAHFDQQVTLEEFDFAASPKLPTAQIRDLAALRWLHNGESILLHGPVGVGKTHVAQALGHLTIRQGAEVRFYKPAASWPTSPAGRPTGPGHNASPSSSAPPCSSSTTSPSASTPPNKPTTSTNSSPNAPRPANP